MSGECVKGKHKKHDTQTHKHTHTLRDSVGSEVTHLYQAAGFDMTFNTARDSGRVNYSS